MRLIGTRESPWIQEKNVHWIAKAVFVLSYSPMVGNTVGILALK
jgi:hypothetical protein